MAGGNIVKSDPTQSVAAAGAAAVPTTWKPNINNGTELWEANLRNGGQPPAPAVQKPWGHTPSTNLGGTWGEDDDGTDSGYVYQQLFRSILKPLLLMLESELTRKTTTTTTLNEKQTIFPNYSVVLQVFGRHSRLHQHSSGISQVTRMLPLM